MKIAISAVLFNNDSLIGAQRPRAFAERLAQRGHDVTVFTPRVAEDVSAVPPQGVALVELPAYAPRATLPGSKLPLWQRLLILGVVMPTIPRALVLSRPKLARVFGVRAGQRAQMFDALNARRRLATARVRAMLDARIWTRQASRVVRSTGFALGEFDAVLSTYGPFGSLWLGEALTESRPRVVRVADIRDAIVQPQQLLVVRQLLARFERRVVRDADVVTVISQGILNGTLKQQENRRHGDKFHVLPNGYQKKQIDRSAETARDAGPLRIGYTGQIYADSREDPAPLFRAFAVLRDAHEGEDFEVHYAGNQGHIMRGVAARYGFEGSVIDHGFLAHSEALTLQGCMDILLVLTWNRKESQGIISGKFGEYLAQEKSILALISGDLPGAELASLIADMNVGHSFEETSGLAGEAELIEYLRSAGQCAAEGTVLPYAPVPEELDKFDYDTIAAKLESLIVAARPKS